VDEPRLQVSHHLDPATATRVEELRTAVERAGGFDPLGEPARSQLAAAAGPDPTDRGGFVGVVATDPGTGRAVGYAHLTRAGAGGDLAVELVVAPGARRAGEGPADALLGVALAEAARPGPPFDPAGSPGPRTVRYWAHHATGDDDRLAAAHGLRFERELLQLRRPLPVEGPRAPVAVRAFVPGTDESAWLEANNRAFASHPEQGGWDLATLREHEQEPWFDPAGFLVHEEDGRLAASCWTKVHGSADPPMGEIYVISVDPAFHGRGLGRAMTLAGLDHLAATGLTVGMLYVDGSNGAAVALYRSIGFTDHHADRAYAGVVGAV
jgi:mycothiol synthase